MCSPPSSREVEQKCWKSVSRRLIFEKTLLKKEINEDKNKWQYNTLSQRNLTDVSFVRHCNIDHIYNIKPVALEIR